MLSQTSEDREGGWAMSHISVFDVADFIIQRSTGEEMSALKLQKLCFYSFGWYAHLTGESLFDEEFYAMEYGPVIGELLTAHATRKTVSRDVLMPQLAVREGYREDLGAYTEQVLGAVCRHYGQFDAWRLVEMTHSETVWSAAWKKRKQGSKRGTLSRSSIVSHFLAKAHPQDLGLDLPPSSVSVLSTDDMARIEEAGSRAHTPFLESMRGLLASA